MRKGIQGACGLQRSFSLLGPNISAEKIERKKGLNSKSEKGNLSTKKT